MSTWPRRLASLAHALLALCIGGQALAEDLRTSIQISRGGLTLNRIINTFDGVITVHNTSPVPLLGPLRLVLVSATPAHIALYNSHGRTESDADFVELPLETGLLMPGTSTSQVVRLITRDQRIAATNFVVDGSRLVESTTIDVQGVFGPAYTGRGEMPVGAGFQVTVNGVVRGRTDESGRLRVLAPAGPVQVGVFKPPSESGDKDVEAPAGSIVPVKVLLDEGKEISEPSRLRMDAARQGLLMRDAPRIVLRFMDARERAVKLARVYHVSVKGSGGGPALLTSSFSLQQDGSVAAPSRSFFDEVSGLGGRLHVELAGVDASGGVHTGQVTVHLADHRLRVQLLAPASKPALMLASVRLTARILGTELRFQAQSDATGLVEFPDLPTGTLSLEAEMLSEGLLYRGAGTVLLGRSALVRLTMLGQQDLSADPAGISIESLPAHLAVGTSVPAAFDPAPSLAERIRRQGPDQGERIGSGPNARQRPMSNSTSSMAAVQILGAAANVLVRKSAQLTVPRGTRHLTLSYMVESDEYPGWVRAQSIYNDTWSVSVLASNAALFAQTRQINSQLHQEPLWRPTRYVPGTTGVIKQVLDVAELTAERAAAFTLQAMTTNVIDGTRPTRVHATLEITETLVIERATATKGEIQTNNNGSYYSIPRPGSINDKQRSFTLDITKPKNAQLTSVNVDALDDNLDEFISVLRDARPGSDGVRVLKEDETSMQIKVRVTVDDAATGIPAMQPSARDLTYRFSVEARTLAGDDLRDSKLVTRRRALWRMPDGLPRFGARDEGGDDWISRGAYGWLVNHGHLVRPVNDISGEHGRNLGHQTHAHGTDIDMYHFHAFRPGASGGENHRLLQQILVTAFGHPDRPRGTQEAVAFEHVSSWLRATRQGLANLTALASVERLIYCLGLPVQGLSAGWCASLIQTGVVERTAQGQTGRVLQKLEFGGGFNDKKMRWQDDHHDHVHITLDPAQIGD